MTIGEAIDRADFLVENQYPDKIKKEWLSTLDGLVTRNVTGGDFAGYDESTGESTVLLVPAPFDEMYVHWLLCKIFLANQELEKYNNAAVAYGELWQQFARHHQRTVGTGKTVRFINYRE